MSARVVNPRQFFHGTPSDWEGPVQASHDRPFFMASRVGDAQHHAGEGGTIKRLMLHEDATIHHGEGKIPGGGSDRYYADIDAARQQGAGVTVYEDGAVAYDPSSVVRLGNLS